MEHGLVVLPDIDRVLPDTQQHGDIFGPDHMALAEHRVLRNAPDDLGDVVAQDLADRFFGFHQFHGFFSPVCY